MNVIKQIVKDGEYGTQTIKMIVKDNERGAQGEKGDKGDSATITAGNAYSIPYTEAPAVMNTGTSSDAVFDFYIPKGERGAQGPQGDKGDRGPAGPEGPAGRDGIAATIAVGTTSTLQPGDDATVTNIGTSANAVFNFGIPKGEKGEDGRDGAIQYTAGTGISISDENVISATGGGGSSTWGSITGTLSDQTDLQNALNAKQNTLTAGDGITITSDTISADIKPADFFTSTTDTKSGTGTSVTLTDVTTAPFVEITPKGDTFQQTYSGKNLFDVSDKTADWGDNASVDADGWITVTGEDNTFTNLYTKPSSNISTSTTYYAVVEVKSVVYDSGTAYLQPASAKATSQSKNSNSLSLNNITAGQTYVLPFETVADFTGTTTMLRTYVYTATAGSSITFRLSVVAANPNPNTFIYEPYVGGTASPNPDYPQDVKVVTGEQAVTVTGKNMLNEATMEQGGFNFRTGENYSHNNQIRSKTIKCLPSTTYVISDNASLGEFAVVYGSQTGTVIEGSNKSTTAKFWSFTTPANAYSMRVRIGSNDYPKNTSGSYNIQIELGSTATAYEPYQSQNYELNLGKNLLEIESSQQGGVEVTLNADGSITCVGTTGNNSYYNFMPYQQALPQMLPAGTYTFSRSGNSSQTRIRLWDSSKTNYAEFYISPSATYATVTTTFDCYYVNGYVSGLSANTQINETLKLQLERGSTATAFAGYKTPLELCKIGTYQDYIYKSNGNWYKHEAIKKVVLDGSEDENWSSRTNTAGTLQMDIVATTSAPTSVSTVPQYCNYASYKSSAFNYGLVGEFSILYNTKHLVIGVPSTTTVESWKTKISANNLIAYFVLATANDVQITDTDLIAQLEALANANSYRDTTHIDTASDGYNLPMILTAEAFTNTLVGITEVIDGKQNKLTAGSNITIIGNTISATDTTYSTMTGASAGSAGASGLVPAPSAGDQDKVLKGDGTWGTVTTGTINDATLTIQQNGTQVATFTANSATNATANITTPVITVTDTDPGEGSALSANNFVAVYGGNVYNPDYSTSEALAGFTWIDGSPVYKKTINFGALPDSTTKQVQHGITNLNRVIKMEGYSYRSADGLTFPLNFSSVVANANSIGTTVTPTYISVDTGMNRTNITECYITLYYTKTS